MSKILFTSQHKISASHLNYGNHLGYDAVLRLFQDSRLEWLLSLGYSPNEANIVNNIGWIISEAHIYYKSEGFYHDDLTIEISCTDIQNASFILDYVAHNQTTNKILSEGQTKQVFIDYKKRKIRKIPEQFLKNLTPK